MNFGRQASEKCAAATLAQNGGTFTGSGQHDDWLHSATARFRAAITLQIPVGYQDETGFHYGPRREYQPQRAEDEAIDRF
jgi:hypothetical protein